MKSLALLNWLYDTKLDAKGIRFGLFHRWMVHLLKAENIEAVSEIERRSIGAWNAYNFKNRFFARSFMIEAKHGWFARKLLISPKVPEEFVAWLREHHVEIRCAPCANVSSAESTSASEAVGK